MPRKPKSLLAKAGAHAKTWKGTIMGTVGVLSGATVTWLLGAVSFSGDLLHSDHPPFAGKKTVWHLAQSEQQIQRHENIIDSELLELKLRDCKRDRTDAQIALSIHPDSRTDKNAIDDANDCIHTLSKLLTH